MDIFIKLMNINILFLIFIKRVRARVHLYDALIVSLSWSNQVLFSARCGADPNPYGPEPGGNSLKNPFYC
jgi:hypothetical protein